MTHAASLPQVDYTIRPTPQPPRLDAPATCPRWATAPALTIDRFWEESSAHRPRTTVRLLYDDAAVYVWFQAEDRYVRCVRTAYQDNVCKDSCVEFFVQPKADHGYFNLETNASGVLLFHYNRAAPAGGRYTPALIDWAHGQQVAIHASLRGPVDPELDAPTTWHLAYRLPAAVLATQIGPLGPLAGQTWRANFFKCGSETSHPHWASWAPLGEKRFHDPRWFAPLHFAAE